MRQMTFCEIVLDQLPYITKGERQAIRAELEAHLADHAAALEAKGCPAGEAAAQAQAAMGDPEEIGRALAGQYPRLWLWACRLLTLCVAAGCLLLFCRGPMMALYYHHSSLLARNDPWGTGQVYPIRGDVILDVDFQAELRTDILRVYRVQVNRETLEATVHFVTYDRSPWGRACSGQSDGISLTNQAGETLSGRASHVTYLSYFDRDGWDINTYYQCNDMMALLTGAEVDLGAAYGFCTIPILPGDDHVTFRYERFGTEAVFQVPLPRWEGEP